MSNLPQLHSSSSTIVYPNDLQYEEKRQIWNSAIDKTPAAIAVCVTEQDVIAAVQLAKQQQWPIAIRSGGHHIGGFAMCDEGFVIDVQQLKEIDIDTAKQTVTIGAGVLAGELNAATQQHGLAVPLGTASTTGVSGVALGGGIGYLRGRYALTCDNLVAARIVTADGTCLVVNEQENADLLWALKGGGGNFGVVTSLTFQAHPIGTDVFAVDVLYDFADAATVFERAQAFIAQADDATVAVNMTVAVLLPAPFLPDFLHFKKVIMVVALYNGDVQLGEAATQPLRQLATPIVDQSGVMPFLQLQQKLDVMTPPRVNCYGTSLYFDDLTPAAQQALISVVTTSPIPSTLIQLWSLGGAVNRVASDATAFAVRDAKYVLLVDAMAMNGEDEACQAWLRDLEQALRTVSNGTPYINGIVADDTVVARAYRQNKDKLIDIKTKYDPQNTFCFNHNFVPKA